MWVFLRNREYDTGLVISARMEICWTTPLELVVWTPEWKEFLVLSDSEHPFDYIFSFNIFASQVCCENASTVFNNSTALWAEQETYLCRHFFQVHQTSWIGSWQLCLSNSMQGISYGYLPQVLRGWGLSTEMLAFCCGLYTSTIGNTSLPTQEGK